jgi:predicted DNA-binding ribbon-helix-helix protein
MMSAVFPRASALGFGCASMGSRVGSREGLRALERALELGVNWFDLAPSYGDGHAEQIFGVFLRGKRQEVHICTKVGIAPPNVGAARRFLRPIVRAVVRGAPALRTIAARGRPVPVHQPCDRKAIMVSLENSLSRLGTDHVDVLALHDPVLEDLRSDAVAEAMDDIVKSGKARVVGVAGSPGAAALAMEEGSRFRHIQLADGPDLEGLRGFRRAYSGELVRMHVVTHSVYSTSCVKRLLAARGDERNRLVVVLADHGYGDLNFESAIRAACLDYCLQSNPTGTVLISMLQREHAEFASARLSAHASCRPTALFEALLRAPVVT